jgi:hypothetical protein
MGKQSDEVEPSEIEECIRTIYGRQEITLFNRKEIRFDPEDLTFHKNAVLPGHTNGMRLTAFDKNGAMLDSTRMPLRSLRVRLHRLARGIDNNEVIPDRPTQSISGEGTLEQDVLLTEMEPMIRRTWAASRNELRIARTVVLKLKTSEFKILTRSHTPRAPFFV